jgi:hypothetical protein
LSVSETQRTFVTLHPALPTLQKLFNSIKKRGRYGVFNLRAFRVFDNK